MDQLTHEQKYQLLTSFADSIGLSVSEYPFKVYDGLIKDSKIGIRSTLPNEEKPVILAHELAHHFLHHGNMINSADPKAEEDADHAGEMLLKFIDYIYK